MGCVFLVCENISRLSCTVAGGAAGAFLLPLSGLKVQAAAAAAVTVLSTQE